MTSSICSAGWPRASSDDAGPHPVRLGDAVKQMIYSIEIWTDGGGDKLAAFTTLDYDERYQVVIG